MRTVYYIRTRAYAVGYSEEIITRRYRRDPSIVARIIFERASPRCLTSAAAHNMMYVQSSSSPRIPRELGAFLAG